MIEKAPNKTTKSAFDIQIEIADKESKSKKGISFVIRKGNQIDYINIPNVPEQTFKYFYNPSKLSVNERTKSIEQRIIGQKILFPEKRIVTIIEDLEL